MNFSIEFPYYFYFIILLLFATFFEIFKYIKLKQRSFQKSSHYTKEISRISFCFWSRTICRFISGVFLILALAEISWGTDTIPVQKSGKAISFVFDISYSMEAKDGPGGISRLQAASYYAQDLLDKMQGNSVSVVLAKGEGVLAVPLTEDFQSVRTIMDCLSPSLMTAEGTSLGNGIRTAISSFPEQSSEASFIWLFTDCEETDNLLQASLLEGIKFGIPIAIIGFGSERESEVFAGDGITKVKTALRASNAENMISALKDKISISRRNAQIPTVIYIDASEMGSAATLLKMINGSSPETNLSLAYEVQSTKRHLFFTSIAIIFFILSILLGEIDIEGGRKKIISSMITSCIFIFTSCSPRFNDGVKIFEGKLEWSKQNYQNSVGYFLEALSNANEREDSLIEQYATFGLGTTYLMQGETDIALARFSQISQNAPDKVRFAVLYNSGIIAHRNGDYDAAADFFKQAILIDGTSTDAKINLELSLKEDSLHSNEAANELVPLSENKENNTLQNELYSIIHEDEKQRWKSMQKKSERTSQDY